MTSIDGLKIRARLGRDTWGVPRRFGPEGWIIDRKDGRARIIVTLGPAADDDDFTGGDWLHASISGVDRMPTYEEMVMMHKAVWPNGYSYQVFAPPSQHVNIHEFVLHLWGKPDGSPGLPEFGAKGTI